MRIDHIATLPGPEPLVHHAWRTGSIRQGFGSIASGELADLVVVDGDPSTRIHDIRRVELVVKDGTLFRPADLHRALGSRATSP